MNRFNVFNIEMTLTDDQIATLKAWAETERIDTALSLAIMHAMGEYDEFDPGFDTMQLENCTVSSYALRDGYPDDEGDDDGDDDDVPPSGRDRRVYAASGAGMTLAAAAREIDTLTRVFYVTGKEFYSISGIVGRDGRMEVGFAYEDEMYITPGSYKPDAMVYVVWEERAPEPDDEDDDGESPDPVPSDAPPPSVSPAPAGAVTPESDPDEQEYEPFHPDNPHMTHIRDEFWDGEPVSAFGED